MFETKSMEITRPRTGPRPDNLSTLDKIATGFILVYQVLALVMFVIIPFLAQSWFQVPFIGVLVEHTLVTNGLAPVQANSWNAYAQGLDSFGNQLQAIDGTPIINSSDIQSVLNGQKVGDDVTLTFVQNDGTTQDYSVKLQEFPSADRVALFYVPYLVGLVYLVAGVWVFSMRRWDISGRTFAIFATSVAIGLGAFFELNTTHRFTHIWTLSISLAGAALFVLALVFPQQARLLKEKPALRLLPYIVGGLLSGIAFTALFNFENPRIYASAWRVEFVFTALGILFYLGWTISKQFRSQSPIAREQVRILLWGSILAFGPIGVWFIATAFNVNVRFQPFLVLPLIIFPIATGYAILRYRLLITDFVISRGLMYGTMMIFSALIYMLLVWSSSMLMGIAISPDNPLLIGVLVFLLVAGFNPLRAQLQKQIDNRFFRGQSIYREYLETFSQELTQIIELAQIIKLLRDYIVRTVNPESCHVFIFDPLSELYSATADVDSDGRPSTDLRFSVFSPLIQTLAQEKVPVFLGDTAELPEHLQPERARLAVLGAKLFVGLPGQKYLAGWLAMGEKKSGEPYHRNDLSFVEALSAQAALAIERAQVVYNLEQRVHEMNVLGRVAQGINITLNFDDILELIFAQTSQVLTTTNFRVTLYDKQRKSFYHAFYLENNERLKEKENQTLQDDVGLEQVVIKSQRPLITDDYETECRNRDVIPDAQRIYAWMGVPLNAGAEAIGSISLGNSDPVVPYTSEQQNLLQAIADQAAGAIIKSQLLEESERRALQLATLNQVGRILTSTLEFSPLLNHVLESAVSILNCEAGSLFLVDEETDELVFEVAVGPVAEDLVGTRLAPGTGLVGKSVNTRQSIIVENVQQDADWSKEQDAETGFSTRQLLVVPMLLRDQVIGVLEVINKTDLTPFNMDDERLLEAFAAQAAISIQNSRLFTMTDQALADRVSELSVMQRIDRELNASLDVERALHITLDWALRWSDADSGFAGMVEMPEEGLARLNQIASSQGYSRNLGTEEYLEVINNLEIIQHALKTGDLQRVSSLEEGEPRVHAQAKSQVVLPVRRQDQILCVLMLESNKVSNFDEEMVEFLDRLSDHAAIAISNAQLYQEVQAANIAKSDFVSFVSHELKTPMTSIRGYTDLILAGAVGGVNDAQTGFLQTIRSNVDRMGTLVSDLADISRIEAGRLRLDYEAVDLQEVVNEVVRSTRGQIDAKEQKLRLIIPENMPKAWADKNRVTQVLTNLVSNAYKYTPEGGEITIRISQEQNRWDPKGTPKVVLLSVKDSGIGIREEDQKQIFTKFFRSDDQKAREAPGTGLGLNITKNLVELQGGKIWFESIFRKGTTFSFTVPISESG